MDDYMKGIYRQQDSIAKLLQGIERPYAAIVKQQDSIAKLFQGMERPYAAIVKQQDSIAKLFQGMERPHASIVKQQDSIAKLFQGIERPYAGIVKQQNSFTRLIQGMERPLADIGKQEDSIRKIMSSLETTFDLQLFDFNGSLMALNDVIIDKHNEINNLENSDQSEYEQELLELSSKEFEDIFSLITMLRSAYNTIDTKKAIGSFWVLLNRIVIIIGLYNFIQGNDIEIYIHNNQEDLLIKSETDGTKIDIYIDKKELPLKLQIENKDERYSGGESI